MLHVVTREQPPCPYCKVVKNYLNINNIPYKEVPLEEAIDKLQEAGIRTVPAIFSDSTLSANVYLGGSEYLKKL